MTEDQAITDLLDAAIAWAEWRHDHGPWEVHPAEDALWRAAEMTGWSACETGDGQ
jgi:hypothetical protein